MRKLIKKILKEGEWDWLSDHEFDIDKVKVGDKFKVVDGDAWFEVDKIKWNETSPELSMVYIKNPDEGWENEFYIKDIIKGLNRGQTYDPNGLEKIEKKEINESDELDWIKDVEPRLPLKIGTCLTFKQYEEVEDWVEDEYGNMVDHGKMDWHIIGKFIDEYNDNKPTFKMVATDRMGEGREIWMEVEKVKELYDRGVYKPCKKQTYLKRIMKEEIDDLGWIKDVEPPSYDSLVGKALYFDPHISTEYQLKAVLKALKMIGFHYGTWADDFVVGDEEDEIIGFYLRPNDGGITYTAWIDEDYEYHISDWVGEPVQVLDGWQVLQPLLHL